MQYMKADKAVGRDGKIWLQPVWITVKEQIITRISSSIPSVGADDEIIDLGAVIMLDSIC